MDEMLKCVDLRKVYPGQTRYALGSESTGVSFSVNEGELFALLGPSGCGKTTTLRIIGGFVTAESGQVEIAGTDVTQIGPYARRTNTVFQSYALFPHMRLGGNVAFGLKMERVPKAERAQRVDQALKLVGLGGMERRKVSELSGGEQQRAALARALVKRPAVLLLDEPLGALDLKLRKQMQDELVQLKRSTGTTFVHVTHDQEEACAIADRIAVMDSGHIVQVDTPLALYRAPRTSYVADFIDAGTVVRGDVTRHSGRIEISNPDVPVRGPAPAWLNGSGPVAAVLPHDRVVVRPCEASTSSGPERIVGRVDRVVFTGSVFDVYAVVGNGFEVRAATSIGDQGAAVLERLTPGAAVELAWRAEDVVFVEDSGAPR
jgi:ABC-type Fe3+/spermidine/putrescine transport system ATPase subunit